MSKDDLRKIIQKGNAQEIARTLKQYFTQQGYIRPQPATRPVALETKQERINAVKEVFGV